MSIDYNTEKNIAKIQKKKKKNYKSSTFFFFAKLCIRVIFKSFNLYKLFISTIQEIDEMVIVPHM